jgi:hypothetical protein
MADKKSKAAERWANVPWGGVQVYKTDYKTGKPESMPFVYDTQRFEAEMAKGSVTPGVRESIEPSMIHAIYDAQRMNPNLKMTPEDIVTMLAQEGRSDLGANYKDVTQGWAHNPHAVDLNTKLREMGYNPYDAGTAALLLDKQMTARRLSEKTGKEVPWQAVWNGLGQTKTGRTGYDYAREFGMNAKNIAANQAAVNLIRQHMAEPVNNRLAMASNNVEPMPIQNYLMPQ